ncbi:MAG TPA: formate/nitrite transporter family protein [Terriglobia bacterium]|jgi:formate/nitrite transporter
MDYVIPAEVVSNALDAAVKKSNLLIRDMLIRGALSGVFLAYATSLVFVALSQGLPALVGAIIFPVGFVMLVLLGFELATGNFALLPAAWMDGRISAGALLRNWFWVLIGNLLGSVFYAVLFYLAITNFGTSNGGALADLVRQTAQKKTLGYAALGASGWGAAFVKAILCNWMVTTGTMLAFVSRSTIGKIAAMWLPITIFFAHGYEHSVVNMFVIPAGMLLGAPVSLKQWWLWNQIPVTLGNILAGALLTGIVLWYTFARTEASTNQTSEAPAAEAVATGD